VVVRRPDLGDGAASSRFARVAAVVLTYNARPSLHRCLDALCAQTMRPAEILVTDNASDEAVDDLVIGIDGATVTRLPENVGPAGGYAAALTAFLESGHEWAWVMDDDCVPDPEALATQMRLCAANRVALASVRWAETGETVNGHGWWGALIPRSVIERVGVPNAELFWWTEDTEYLQWRIPRAGFEVVWTERPVLSVSRGRLDTAKPAWKYYYETRNQVYYRLYVQRTSRRPVPYPLRWRVRARRATRSVGKLAARVVLRGRLGRTVLADSPDRPWIHEPPTSDVTEPSG
jgi:rhamnopyranosyl-N-acetylglucosaminyl-diphospho-decaprenol beta-1,3/1,4-galactofuranosyltransferase